MSKSCLKKKNVKSQSLQKPAVQEAQPFPEQVPEAAAHEPGLCTMIGVIHTDLFERLLKPAFMSFAHRRDDEPLRQLVESVVTVIAMRDAYDGYRKIDDICQRYLYYLETVQGAVRKHWENIELNALCDYWRTQVLMTLVRDSSVIFNLLLPDSFPKVPVPVVLSQSSFLDGVYAGINERIDSTDALERESCQARDVFDFARGISFPWIGFDPEGVFALLHSVPNEDLFVEHGFAMIGNSEIGKFYEQASQSLHDVMLLDLIYAQHHRLFEEISSAFSGEDCLPESLKSQLEQRVRFDKTYQHAFDSLINGEKLTKSLHRSSRLAPDDLSAYGSLVSMLRQGMELGMGVYLFHFIG